MQQNERKASRTRSPRGKSPSGGTSRWLCKDYLKGTCNNSFCEKWHPPECLFYKTKSGCRFGEKCSYAHRQVDNSRLKGPKRNEICATIFSEISNDRTGLTRSAVFLIFFIVVHAVGNLHVFKGSNGYGYFHVRL